jgi:dihydrofolate reductase
MKEEEMGRVVVTEFVSLDGVMEDPGGAEKRKHGAWTFQFNRGPEGDKFKYDELKASDAMLLGRVTYQGFAAAWPNIKDEQGFADHMNNKRKYVVSNTLKDSDATWNNSRVIRGDVVAEVRKLKAQPGGDILVAGSARLVRTLFDNDLVDEYRLMVFPIVLGSGKRLFDDAKKASKLSLVESRTAGDGVLMLRYQPADSAAKN